MHTHQYNLTKKIISLISLLFITAYTHSENELTGLGSFFYTDNNNKSIQVWYYQPKNNSENSKVLFVMHGTKRNALDYRNHWIDFADKTGTLILSPEFSAQDYPGSRGYHLGNIFDKDKRLNDPTLWTYTSIDMIFSYVQTLTQTKQTHYDIYGHSAGAQFVHRMILFGDNSKIRTAIAANAGWYTLPSEQFNFPYGLNQSPKTKNNVETALAKHLIILLGENDTNSNHKYLKKTPEALAQGKHRLARGKYFFKTASKLAEKQNLPFNWDLKTVADAGHNNRTMSAAAALLLYDK